MTNKVTDEGQTSGQAGGQVSEHVVKISKVSKVHNDTLKDTLEYKIINLIKLNPSITQKIFLKISKYLMKILIENID